jgi:hypothetical protein
MNQVLKKPAVYGQIGGYSKSISYFDRQMFVVDNNAWKIQVIPLTAFNYHSHQSPKIQRPLESRLLWVDRDALTRLNKNQEQRINQLLNSSFMQFTVDIRSNMLSSRKLTFEIIQIASKFVLPKMPKRPMKTSKNRSPKQIKVDNELLNDVKLTMKNNCAHRVMGNRRSLLPIQLESESLFLKINKLL